MSKTNSPFRNLKIDDYSFLNSVKNRSPCNKCNKSRKYFCYTCCLLVDSLSSLNLVPKVKLPIKIDIIKHKREIDGKSTAIHSKLLAPEDVRIFEYPDIPDYSNEEDVYLLFPSVKSKTVSSLFQERSDSSSGYKFKPQNGHNLGTLMKKQLETVVTEEEKANLWATNTLNPHKYTLENLPIKKVVLIDSTWNQCRYGSKIQFSRLQ